MAAERLRIAPPRIARRVMMRAVDRMNIALRILLSAMAFAGGLQFLSFPAKPAWAGASSPLVEQKRKPLGVTVAPVPPGAKGVLLLDRDRGMVIVNVVPGGVADQAGLRKGDVLLSINGRLVDRENDLIAALSVAAETGQAVAQISRQGKILDIPIAF
jgi:membrane-associated protease RseP (regulator of RpoE activity)